MEKDAEELYAMNEEIYTDAALLTPLPAISSNQTHARDTPSDEGEDEYNVSGEHLAGE